jgi:hypothetical protein
MKNETVANVWSVNHYVGQQVAALHASVHGGGEAALKEDAAETPGVWSEVRAP